LGSKDLAIPLPALPIDLRFDIFSHHVENNVFLREGKYRINERKELYLFESVEYYSRA
jgi:hypothetical protein